MAAGVKPELLHLPALAVICGLVLSLAWATLQPAIERNREAFEAAQLLEVIGRDDARIVEIAPNVYAVASNDTGIDSFIFEVTTNEGYNGRIELWVGIGIDGVIDGVRVKHHRETPGLGDGIELAVSDWITQFRGYSTSTPESAWDVERDGGEFDQFTGATITPRAVVHAAEDSLAIFEASRERWLEEARGAL